jgi:hypothetical protein
MLVLRDGRGRELDERQRARCNEQIRLHDIFSGEGGGTANAPPPR